MNTTTQPLRIAAIHDLSGFAEQEQPEQAIHSPVGCLPKSQRIAAIHDLSGFGRCSLSVIMPIISAMGIQVCPVPTAILSTHTGGFDDMVFRDMTDYVSRAYEHYKALDLEFDAVYSGFLASDKQIDSCLQFFRGYPAALKVVDPVMGDNGKPYKTYTPQLCARMSELTRIADIITPNLTEAAILLGEDYTPVLTPALAENWLKRLCEHAGIAVITGAVINNQVCNIGLDRNTANGLIRCDYEHIPVHYPGTGDIFASVLTGAVVGGNDLQTAMNRATHFARKAVKVTYKAAGESRNGVMFEGLLHELR
jgi:pyridoxine kinase